MADELGWPVEEIPDADSVFMRAHREYFREGALQDGVFQDRGGMSVNWDKYASAETTKNQARGRPEDNAVISMPVIGIRQIDDLRVEHRPDMDTPNRAHSDVFGLPQKGEQLTKLRFLLGRIATIVIPLARLLDSK